MEPWYQNPAWIAACLAAAGLLGQGLRSLMAVRRRDIAQIDGKLGAVNEHLGDIDKKLGVQNSRISKSEINLESQRDWTKNLGRKVEEIERREMERRRMPRDE